MDRAQCGEHHRPGNAIGPDPIDQTYPLGTHFGRISVIGHTGGAAVRPVSPGATTPTAAIGSPEGGIVSFRIS